MEIMLTKRSPRPTLAFAVGLLALALCPGCGSRSAPRTIGVSGRVTYQGKPVTSGTIIFHPLKPAEGSPSRPATGQLQSDGTYELSTFSPGDGAVPGEYGISITSLLSGPTPDNPQAAKVYAIPRKYTSPLTSGLTATVPAEGKEPLVMEFDLEEQE